VRVFALVIVLTVDPDLSASGDEPLFGLFFSYLAGLRSGPEANSAVTAVGLRPPCVTADQSGPLHLNSTESWS